jgi:hypothetical protein
VHVPIVLTVHPHDEALGAALAACTLPVWERWAAGEKDTDGSIICWSGFSIRLSQKSFLTVGEAAHAALGCIAFHHEAVVALRDCPAVRDMTLFLHLSCRRGTGPQARLPQELTDLARELRLRVQAHGADGGPIAEPSAAPDRR